MLGPLLVMISVLWGRLQQLREDDRGMTTETMIVTAILAFAALTVVGIIAAAITRKGNEIEDNIDGALAVLR
jgi:hypothetical protein